MENNIELEKKADEVIDLLEGAQEEDGYLNTYFQLVEPEKKWSNILECHELYCACLLYTSPGPQTIVYKLLSQS